MWTLTWERPCRSRCSGSRPHGMPRATRSARASPLLSSRTLSMLSVLCASSIITLHPLVRAHGLLHDATGKWFSTDLPCLEPGKDRRPIVEFAVENAQTMKQREQREAGKKGQSLVGCKLCCGRRSSRSEADGPGRALIFLTSMLLQDFRQGQSVHKERRCGLFPLVAKFYF